MDILTGTKAKFTQVMFFFQEEKPLLRYGLLLLVPDPERYRLGCRPAEITFLLAKDSLRDLTEPLFGRIIDTDRDRSHGTSI